MRWERLFADLEAQLAAAGQADEVADLVRAEVGRTPLADRLRAGVGAPVRVRLADGGLVEGRLAAASGQWLVVATGPEQALVPLAALVSVSGLPRSVAPPAGAVEQRLGLGAALRGLAADRVPVRLQVGGAGASWALAGTLDRVGADHVELAVHPVDEPRRPGAVTDVVAVPFTALLAVRSAVLREP